MDVYRITTTKWSNTLKASGYAGRWNLKGQFTLYAAGNRSLACLENLVHRSHLGLNSNFAVMTIELPDIPSQTKLSLDQLPEDWYLTEVDAYRKCQLLADRWYQSMDSLILSVPSAIIPEEYNYLINTEHPQFKEVKLKSSSSFLFDQRLS